jgi:hypothetical protein
MGFPSWRGGIAFEEEVWAMTSNYRKYDEDFKQGAVQLVTETGKPIAKVARIRGCPPRRTGRAAWPPLPGDGREICGRRLAALRRLDAVQDVPVRVLGVFVDSRQQVGQPETDAAADVQCSRPVAATAGSPRAQVATGTPSSSTASSEVRRR